MSSSMPGIPLYASISWTGESYAIWFKKTARKSGFFTGDSDKVFEMLLGSGIPLVDFRYGNAFGSGFVVETSILEPDDDPANYTTLDQYLDKCRAAGVRVTTL